MSYYIPYCSKLFGYRGRPGEAQKRMLADVADLAIESSWRSKTAGPLCHAAAIGGAIGIGMLLKGDLNETVAWTLATTDLLIGAAAVGYSVERTAAVERIHKWADRPRKLFHTIAPRTMAYGGMAVIEGGGMLGGFGLRMFEQSSPNQLYELGGLALMAAGGVTLFIGEGASMIGRPDVAREHDPAPRLHELIIRNTPEVAAENPDLTSNE